MPPWPGISPPVSLTPRSRFIADMVMSPRKPEMPRMPPAERRPAPVHGREIGTEKTGHDDGGGDAADQPLPSLFGAHAQRHLVAAKQLAPAILCDIVELSEHHEEEEEPDA